MPRVSMADMKQLSLVIMCVQNGATPLILRWAMTGEAAAARFDSTQAVLCQEFLKVLMSMGLLLAEEQWVFGSLVNVLHSEAIGRPKETLKLAVPAVLYFILNVCLQLAAAELPAAVFQVAYQGKTLVVALFSVILLSKRLSRIQWLAIMLLGLGLACVQLGRNSESKVTASTHEQSVAKGLIIVLVGCVCSGLAGVYFEKIMKGSPGSKAPSMWLKNIQLAGFSCLIGCLQQISKLILGAESRPFMYGFTPGVWLMIFNNAIGGLCVAIVIKYADNILKGFATALATVWAALASVPLFGFALSVQFCTGTAIVLGSTLLYGGTISLPGIWWAAEPEACRSLRRGDVSANADSGEETKALLEAREGDEKSASGNK